MKFEELHLDFQENIIDHIHARIELTKGLEFWKSTPNREFIRLFFEHNDRAKIISHGWYQTVVSVLQEICTIAGFVCPFINQLPA